MQVNSEKIKEQIANVELAKQNLNQELQNLIELQEKNSNDIEEKYPISSFVDKQYIRFRSKWGYFTEDHVKESLDNDSVEHFKHLSAHSIKNGEELNTFAYTNIFDSNKNYVIYVEYFFDDWNDYDEFKKELEITPFDNREIYEYLIFEI